MAHVKEIHGRIDAAWKYAERRFGHLRAYQEGRNIHMYVQQAYRAGQRYELNKRTSKR